MAGVYEIYVQGQFSAAHSLEGYDGDCAGIHGHNWDITVCIKCTRLNHLGMGVDFRDVRKVVTNVLERLDHSHLNTLPEFERRNPTAENIARLLFRETAARLDAQDIKVAKIKVFESPGCGASYREE